MSKFFSRKFISFVLSLLILSGILITALLTQVFTMAMSLFMAVGIIGVCSLCIGYILGQASLEKFMSGISSFGGKQNNDDNSNME